MLKTPQHSSLSAPQTVAECVLYYYLTKKNENYKSLVRRSYRRRGKSQVRGGGGAVGLQDWFPACSTASAMGTDVCALLSLGPSQWWFGPTPWGCWAYPSSREESSEHGGFILSQKILELKLVTHGPCG